MRETLSCSFNWRKQTCLALSKHGTLEIKLELFARCVDDTALQMLNHEKDTPFSTLH